MKNINDVISNVDEVINKAVGGNLDEVLSKTKSYAERATRRSAERLEISRKKIELLDAKTKLSKAYEKFGRLSYEQYAGGEAEEDKFHSCIAEIELQKTRAELLDKEIEELRILFTENAKKEETSEEKSEVEIVEVEPTE